MGTLAALLVALCALGTCTAERGFVMTFPKHLIAGTTEHLSFTVVNVLHSGTVHVRIVDFDTDEVMAHAEFIAVNQMNLWVEIEIPPVRKDTRAKLRVSGTLADGYRIEGEKEVLVRHVSGVTFIQTDKPIYKPGQTVKFRVLPLDNHLKPLDHTKSARVWVQDPQSVVMAEWKELAVHEGIIQLELPLSPEPPLGTWSIGAVIDETANFHQTFEVQKYILPKFEVEVKPPAFVMADADIIPVEVCAWYTYGKKVDGTFKVKVSYKRHSWEKKNRAIPSIKYSGLISGCETISIHTHDLLMQTHEYSYRTLQFDAKVAENGTGAESNSSALLDITHSPLQITFLGQEEEGKQDYFKPGIPYYAKLLVTKPDGSPAASEKIEVCAHYYDEAPSFYNPPAPKERRCHLFTTDKKGHVYFSVAPCPSHILKIALVAEAVSYEPVHYNPGVWREKLVRPSATLELKAWFSPSGNYMQIQPVFEELECDSRVALMVRYTLEKGVSVQFFNLVMSRGRLSQQGSHQRFYYDMDHRKSVYDLPAPPRRGNGTERREFGEFWLAFEPRATMSPAARILVFYVRDDGEIVADARAVRITQCFKNKVNLHFRHEQQFPSTEATMLLSADPSSLCGIGLVDKSVRLRKQEEHFNKQNIFKIMDGFDVGRRDRPRQVTDEYCVRGSSGLKLIPRSFDGLFTPLTSKTSHHVDTIMAFEEAGMIVMTDLTLETRPCVDVKPVAVSFNMDKRRFRIDLSSKTSGADPPEVVVNRAAPTPQVRETVPEPPQPNPADEIRNYFPETWLWEMHEVGSSGQAVVKRELPHTLTQWVGGAVCVNPHSGLGLFEETNITAFQPFFISFDLPYSVVRGERVPLLVSVFNYLSECLPIKLSLEESAEYRIESASRWRRLCVCGGESRSHRFSVRPGVLGRVNITVYAFSLEDDDEAVCGNEVTARLSARDALSKQLLVEAEGFPKEEVFNHFVCPENTNGTYATEVDLLLPEDIVNGSARAFVSVTGDLLGPALNGLSHLVRLPVGCGEQNMVLFAPNVFVLDYLTAIGRASDRIREDCLHNMNIGYQRQMRYRHADGSYSAFGPGGGEESGSLWLTAFVLRSTGAARRLMQLPWHELVHTADFVLGRQLENGCFGPAGRILNRAIQGGLSAGDHPSLAPLTAYVLISLMESGTQSSPRESIRKGLRCLESESNPNTYALGLFAYATALADAKRAARHYLDKLEERAIVRGGHKFWRAPPVEGGSPAVNVEIAGYYILSKTKLEGERSVTSVLPVVRWLAQQRNSRGGFVSTQDTVIALQALAQYSALQLGRARDLGLVVESDDLVQGFKVDEYNKLVTQAARIPALPTVVDLQAVGDGCALVQFTLRYNVERVSGNEALHLSVSAGRIGSHDCNLLRISVCIRYKIPDQKTNMAVVSVKMLSGFLPDQWSLDELLSDPEVQLKRHELDANRVNLYFYELTNELKCFKFFIRRDSEVEDAQPSSATLFDYYQPDLETSKEFTFPSTCSDPPLPDLPEFPVPTFPIEPDGAEPYTILPVPEVEHVSTVKPVLDCEEVCNGTLNANQTTETTDPSDTSTHPTTEESKTTASVMPEMVTTVFSETPLTPSEDQLEEQADDASLHQSKANTSHLVNFVDVDHDLAFPDGVEGNVPVSVLPTSVEATTRETTTEEAPNCPVCTTQLPQDFNDVYCNSAFALRVAVRDSRARTVKILQDVSYFLPHAKPMKKFAKLEYDPACACAQLLEKGSTHFILGTPTDLWSSELEKHRISLTSQVYVIATPPRALQTELLKTARKACSSDP